MTEMDDLDLNIASLFDKQGSLSCNDVASQLGLSISTVRRRMTRMMENGEIENRVFVDMDAFPEMYLTVVGISLQVSPDRCLPEIRKIPQIFFLMCVTGKYDIIAFMVITSRKILSRVTRQLIDIEGVTYLETFIVTDNYDLKIPAGKLSELIDLEKMQRSQGK